MNQRPTNGLGYDLEKMQKRNCCASSVNRTRASSMATMNSTTRPMMLVDGETVLILYYSPATHTAKHAPSIRAPGSNPERQQLPT